MSERGAAGANESSGYEESEHGIGERFIGQVRECQQALIQGQETLEDIALVIGKELAIGQGQCARLVSQLRAAEAPVQTLLSWWSAPERLPLPIRPTRHALLVLLIHTTEVGADLDGQISYLSEYYRSCSRQQAQWQRQQLQSQLEALGQCRQQIVGQLDQVCSRETADEEIP